MGQPEAGRMRQMQERLLGPSPTRGAGPEQEKEVLVSPSYCGIKRGWILARGPGTIFISIHRITVRINSARAIFRPSMVSVPVF